MGEKKLVPKRRFKGFSGNWNLLRIDSVFSVLDGDRGSNYPGESDFYKTGYTLFLDTGNVTQKGFNFSTKKYITQGKDESLGNGKLEIGDFVLTSRGTLGNVAFYGRNIFKKYPSMRINSAMLILRQTTSEDISSSYMESVFRGNVIESFMTQSFVGSAQPHITKKEFSNLDLSIPNTLKEQQKIGAFFKILDERIANQERKIAKVKALKAAYLTETFPQEGETVPKRRFNGFEEEWQEEKLGNIVELVGTGKSKFLSNSTYSNERPFAILGSTSVIGYDSDFDYEGNFILTARVGVNAGNLYTFSGKVKISDNTVFIKNDNLHFLYYILNSYNLKLLSFGTGQPLIKSSELREIKVL